MKILWLIALWSMYITVSILIPVLVMSVEKTTTVKTINMPQIPLWSLGLWLILLVVVSCFFINKSSEKKEDKKEEDKEKEKPQKEKKSTKKEESTFRSFVQIIHIVFLGTTILLAIKWLNLYEERNGKSNVVNTKTEIKEKVERFNWKLGWGKDEKNKNNMFNLPLSYNLWFNVETNKLNDECLDFYILNTNKPIQKIHFVLNRLSNEKIPRDKNIWFGNYTNAISGRYGTIILKKETDTRYVGKAKFTGECEKTLDVVIIEKK